MNQNRSEGMPKRKQLPHVIPSWVTLGTCYFITVCTTPKGRNQLAISGVADSIVNAFRFNMNRGIWWADLVVVMPDHVHALMWFSTDPGIRKSLSDWKHFLARVCHVDWQRDYFEHRLRNDENREEKAYYIRMNPVRGGLVAEPEEWPFAWSGVELAKDGGQGTDRPTQTDGIKE